MDKHRTKISVAIISNESNPLLISTIRSYADVVDEVCLGLNGEGIDHTYILQQTEDIANLRIIEVEWKGYGDTKNALLAHVSHEWVLSVDADEMASAALQDFLRDFNPLSEHMIYQFRLINHLGAQSIHFGAWGQGKKYYSRLFNKKKVRWNNDQVHEELVYSQKIVFVRVNAELLHYSAAHIREVKMKNDQYARLSAQVKYDKGQKAGVFKKYFSFLYTFLKELIFQLGFLDGINGWRLAYENAVYSYKKYQHLHLMSRKKG